MAGSTLLYLSRADVERVAPDMPTIIDLLETAFREKGEDRVEMPPKLGLHLPGDAFLHAMPGFVRGLGAAGVKWVGGSPENRRRGVPYISALILLSDVETMRPYAVMDGAWITAHRTGAASALAAKYLARPKSEVLGIVACGEQGRTHLLALSAVFPIRRVLAYDVDQAARDRYIAEMAARTGLAISGVDRARRAIEESDIVVTSGPIRMPPRPEAEAGWLRPGAFASAVDYDSYWTPAALAEMDKLATDDFAQFRSERAAGHLQGTPEPYADLGEIVAGRKPGRESDRERILAMNLGLALDDLIVAVEIYRRATDRGIGTRLSL